MKKFSLVLVVAFALSAMTACSSKEAAVDEPLMSGAGGGADAYTESASSADSANLGGSSSGQGR